MKAPTRRFAVPVFFAFAVVLVVVNGWVALQSLRTLVRNEDWLQHTWQVIAQIELIMSSVKDAETGVRGFVITGKDTYLAPYVDSARALPGQLAELQRLTEDNTSQQERIAAIRAAIDQRLSTLAESIDARRNNQIHLQAMIASGTGKQQMDRLRALANTMDAEEQRLLQLRQHDTAVASRDAHGTLALASLLDLILLVFMARYFVRERNLRVASELAAEHLAVARNEAEASRLRVLELNASLEERVQQRTAELETTNRELEAFSYSVSHDLRAPLRTIDGFSLALAEDYADLVDSTGQDYIVRVRSGVQRMGQLIDALLQLSRITRAEITRETVDVSALAGAVVADLVDPRISPQPTFQIDPGLAADADPKLLRVALENLLGNAVKFSSKVAAPHIHFGWDPAQNAFFVADNGAGFDMYYADKLFNAFNRLHGDKDFKGSGIGLATVARVIRRHHGRIWARAVVDHGATFWFTLR